MSRKLLFVAGLLTVFSCVENASVAGLGEKADIEARMQHLLQFVRSTPLDIVAWTLPQIGCTDECASLFGVYDTFLSKLKDEELRAHLESLKPMDSYEDPEFQECRELSHEFQSHLNKVFFELDTELRKFITQYGVF